MEKRKEKRAPFPQVEGGLSVVSESVKKARARSYKPTSRRKKAKAAPAPVVETSMGERKVAGSKGPL